MYVSSFTQKLCRAALLASILLSTTAEAATQGSLGNTSTGSANISVTKSVQAQITDLSDMTLANWTVGSGAVTLYSNACIYSSTGNYQVTATGSGLLGAYTISSGILTAIPYTVAWNAGGAGSLASTGTALTAGLQSGEFSNANNGNATCSGGGSANDTARVIVSISSAAMTAATSSNTAYTGTLTLVVAPY
jgi:hypothetical protein